MFGMNFTKLGFKMGSSLLAPRTYSFSTSVSHM